MSEITLYPCPSCNEVCVSADDIFCNDCAEGVKRDTSVYNVFESIEVLDKQNFSKLTSQHRRIIHGAASKLEAILLVLEKYPAKE